MKTSIAVVASALAFLAAAAAGGAGGPQYSPGVGAWTGVVDRSEGVRYVTLYAKSSTLVTAIRVKGGQPLRARSLRGFLGIPLVTYNGTAGGLSGNGKRLVVATYAPTPGQSGNTRFVVLDTKSLRARHSVVLDGSWSFDAISPDGSTLFLTEHITAGKNPRYRVRSYDVRARRSARGARRSPRERAGDGRRPDRARFEQRRPLGLHALRPSQGRAVRARPRHGKRVAYCIGLPYVSRTTASGGFGSGWRGARSRCATAGRRSPRSTSPPGRCRREPRQRAEGHRTAAAKRPRFRSFALRATGIPTRGFRSCTLDGSG